MTHSRWLQSWLLYEFCFFGCHLSLAPPSVRY